jgi:PQQ-dependent dehydrogenase (s-GDH family)
MKKSYLLGISLFVLSNVTKAQVIDSTTILFNIDTIGKNLGYPWEITYGPDDSLWITEARGYRVVRISSSRNQTQKDVPSQQVLKIPLGTGEINFDRSSNRWPQGGMQGLAIHPDFMTDINKRWVYLSYVYKKESCPNGSSGAPCKFRTKIVRCRFYFAADAGNPCFPLKDTLTIMDTVISNLPGSNDHNSGRLTISPFTEGPDNKYKVYYTIGDMGAGQFNNDTRTNHAQTIDTCEGKILRLNTEPDGDASFGVVHEYNTWRQWIPNDNPYNHSVAAFSALKTPVYSFGHRNAQGIVWGNVNGTWRLYSSEHGDKSDDEVNNIFPATNYGWPKVAGIGTDNNYSSLDAFVNNDNLASQPVNYAENTWAGSNNMQRPLFATFNWAASAIPADGSNIFTWGTIAPSSIDLYKGNIPGWKNSLLVTSLKYGMYRLKLKSTGDYVDSASSTNTVDTFPLLHSWRVRDVAINPNANSGIFWVVMDSTGSTSGPTGGFSGSNNPTKDGGKILRLSYKSLITLPLNDNPRGGPPIVKDLIQIFPNPVVNIIHVHGKKELRKPLLVQICDIHGRMLKEGTSFRNDFEVDVSSLIPGTYLLKLFNGYDMEVQIEKFIKQ